MTYLSRGKRSLIEQGYGADVRAWAKAFKIDPPTIRVRQKRSGGNYRLRQRTISMPPDAGRAALVHEFAHHLNAVLYGQRGHGPSFRIALVQVATVAYGRADAYPWAGEYQNVARWARTHGLTKGDAV
jgi:hypothetical protein